jgi:hypothetical protein
MYLLAGVALVFAAVSPINSQLPGFADGVCMVSKDVPDKPPDDPGADSFAGMDWYANVDRTVWAHWWGRRSNGEYKVLWVRPVGAQLTIAGRRLDRESAPLTARIPDGYAGGTYHATSLYFPSAGCWRIDATAGKHALAFVINVPTASGTDTVPGR